MVKVSGDVVKVSSFSEQRTKKLHGKWQTLLRIFLLALKSVSAFVYIQPLYISLRFSQAVLASVQLQYVLEWRMNDDLMIAVAEPRRLAAVSLASRVAEERQSLLGKQEVNERLTLKTWFVRVQQKWYPRRQPVQRR